MGDTGNAHPFRRKATMIFAHPAAESCQKKTTDALSTLVLFLLAWIFVCFQCRSIPFYTNPALLQDMWISAFGEAFFNTVPPAMYSHNFGFPTSLPMVFGITVALPVGVLIHCGIHPTDAYTIVFSLFLGIALWGAWRLAMRMGCKKLVALLGAVLWCTFPIISQISKLSTPGIGFVLMPTYFLILLVAYERVCEAHTRLKAVASGIGYILMMVFALFTEGYAFMMFVCVNVLFLMYLFLKGNDRRERLALLFRVLPLTVFAILFAYLLYTAYTSGVPFDNVSPIATFRAHGLDLFSLFFPIPGEFWIADFLGTTIEPDKQKLYFGERVEWVMFYSVPLFLLTSLCFFLARNRKKSSLLVFFIILAVVGLYLSLGPSLKYDAHVNAEVDIVNKRAMDENFAPIPTGSRFLWENIPGFKNMRVTSRWALVFFFSLWAADMICLGALSSKNRKMRACAAGILGLCIILYMPPSYAGSIKFGEYCRRHHFHVDNDFVEPLRGEIDGSSKVAFLPFSNDFIASYLAARLNIRTYNTGQDKTLGLAMKNWPEDFPRFAYNDLADGHRVLDISRSIAKFLQADPERIVILPLIDLDWFNFAVYAKAGSREKSIQTRDSAFLPLVQELEKVSGLSVVRKPTYYSIRSGD